jgi:hypothetical protein
VVHIVTTRFERVNALSCHVVSRLHTLGTGFPTVWITDIFRFQINLYHHNWICIWISAKMIHCCQEWFTDWFTVRCQVFQKLLLATKFLNIATYFNRELVNYQTSFCVKCAWFHSTTASSYFSRARTCQAGESVALSVKSGRPIVHNFASLLRCVGNSLYNYFETGYVWPLPNCLHLFRSHESHCIYPIITPPPNPNVESKQHN